MDTFTTLYNRLLLRCPIVGPLFAQDLVKDAFKQFCERRAWSWRQKSGVIAPQSFLTPGTVSLTPGSAVVTGSGTSFTTALINSQFRAFPGNSPYPAQTILQVPSTTTLVLDSMWKGPASSGLPYQLFQALFILPADFQSFVSLVNSASALQLHTTMTQSILDRYDPQRTKYGPAYSCAFLDYFGSSSGSLGDTIPIVQAGPAPVFTTSGGFTYPFPLTYIVTITTGGAIGASQFTWRQAGGATSSTILTDTNLLDIENGVQIYFPDGTYILGDVFIANCSPATSTANPRYEFWPRPDASSVYPYLYKTKVPELSDESPNLPSAISHRGDVILELALMKCAEFPGLPSSTADGGVMKNPYYDLNLARRHQGKYEEMANQLEMNDEEMNMVDFTYTKLPFYPAPWLDGEYQQSHDIYPLI